MLHIQLGLHLQSSDVQNNSVNFMLIITVAYNYAFIIMDTVSVCDPVMGDDGVMVRLMTCQIN